LSPGNKLCHPMARGRALRSESGSRLGVGCCSRNRAFGFGIGCSDLGGVGCCSRNRAFGFGIGCSDLGGVLGSGSDVWLGVVCCL
jgi:hypothetical protein